jgi:hypothetical protein
VMAALLLCLPLLHATFLASSELAAYMDSSPRVWDDELDAIIALDQKTSLPAAPILVVGGQWVRLWRSLPAALQPAATLLRPLGDPTVEDISHHYDRLIAFYRPGTLIVMPSYADLHIRDHKTPEDLGDALRRLFERDSDYGLSSRRYALVPLKTLLHPQDDSRIDAMAQKMRSLEDDLESLVVLDPNPLLQGEDGRPDPDFFRGDGINLNDVGYARLSLFLRSRLEADGILTGRGQRF